MVKSEKWKMSQRKKILRFRAVCTALLCLITHTYSWNQNASSSQNPSTIRYWFFPAHELVHRSPFADDTLKGVDKLRFVWHTVNINDKWTTTDKDLCHWSMCFRNTVRSSFEEQILSSSLSQIFLVHSNTSFVLHVKITKSMHAVFQTKGEISGGTFFGEVLAKVLQYPGVEKIVAKKKNG